MDFKKYNHVVRLGTDETEGLLNGKVYVFSKIDGTNTQVYLGDDGTLKVGNRNKELTAEEDNYHSLEIIKKDKRYADFFNKYQNLRLYGEFLAPHHIKSYLKDAWRKLYIFDVMRDNEYIPYEEYVPLLEEFGIEYIPLMTTIDNPTEEQLYEICGDGMFLQSEGGHPEGIVIKRYGFINRYKRTQWGKIIHSEFRKKSKVNTVTESVYDKIIFKYITDAFVEKEYAKFVNDVGEVSGYNVPRFFNSIWHTFIEEEMWNIVKKLKNPTIDFSVLYGRIVQKIKEVKPEIGE